MSRTTGGKQHRSKADRRAVERRTMASAASSASVGPIDRRAMDRRAAARRTVGIGSLQVRHWTVIAGVSVIALGAGVLVAGVPSPSDAFVIPADATSTSLAESRAVLPVVVSTAPVEVVVEEVVEEVAVETTAPATTAPAPETTAVPSTTAAPTTTAAPVTTDAPVPVAELDIVVANGAGVTGLARRAADALVSLGYMKPYTTDAAQLADATTVFFAEGFADEAAILAADLNAPGARIEPKPDAAVTADGSGAAADLVVVLGPPA